MDKKRGRNISRKRMEHSSITAAGCVVYAKNTQRYLFLLRNSDNKKNDRTWGLVGGKVEEGESVIQGLQREVSEELSTSFEKYTHLETFTSNNELFVFHTFLTQVEEEFIPILNEEHVGYCWVPIKEYPRPLHPGVWKSFKFDSIVKKLETVQQLANISF